MSKSNSNSSTKNRGSANKKRTQQALDEKATLLLAKMHASMQRPGSSRGYAPISLVSVPCRHKVQQKLMPLIRPDDMNLSAKLVHLEECIAINSCFDSEWYEETATMILFALQQMATEEVLHDFLQKKSAEKIATMNENSLFPDRQKEGSMVNFTDHENSRHSRRARFDSLISKLTSDLAPDGHPLLQCRRCGGQADFNPVQTRSADEPMTIFCTCLNEKCKARWKM